MESLWEEIFVMSPLIFNLKKKMRKTKMQTKQLKFSLNIA